MKTSRYAAFAFAALLAALPACTVLNWGGPPAGANAPTSNADEIFKEGETLLAKGDYKQARKKYNEIRAHDPERFYDALVEVRLGDSYYEQGRYAEAEVEYKRFLSLHPKNKAAPYVLYQVGMCNFRQIDLPDRDPSFAENSIKDFSKLLKEFPGNPYEDEAKEKLRLSRAFMARHEFVIGWFYYEKDDYKAAARRFKGIISRYPGSQDESKVLYYLADSYIRLKKYGDAKDTLSVLYQGHPNNRYAERAKKDLATEIPAK